MNKFVDELTAEFAKRHGTSIQDVHDIQKVKVEVPLMQKQQVQPSSLKHILHLLQELSIGEMTALKDHIWHLHYNMQEAEKAKLKELL